jgi:1-acyl-sn-glycerol-3-phosphate acyltransferase
MTNLAVTGFADLFLPFALWWGYYDGIDIDERSLKALNMLRGKRAFLCPNHSSGHDPGIIYSLEHLMGERFCFVAAREIFDWWHGWLGWLIQGVGAFSVNRLVADRSMVATVQRLLVSNKRKLVVFPEGDISYRNDSLLPVEDGLAALFLRTACAVQAAVPGEPLYVVPIALVYRYVQDISKNLHNALVRIELTLRINDHGGTVEERFERARGLILQQLPPRMREHRRARALASFVDGQHTWETLAAGVDLIERALYTRVTQKGHRRVQVHVGTPIDIGQWLAAYRANRRETARGLAQLIESRLAELLGVQSSAERILSAS